MAIRKRIPENEEEYDLMLETLAEKCPNYKTTLDISDAKLLMVSSSATAYHGWRLFKNQLSETKTSITQICKQLFEGDPKDALPALPDLTLTAPPMPGKPGIEKQIDKFIGDIERHDNFTDAVGLDLGFYIQTSDAAPEERTGDFKTKDFAGYGTDIIFSLKGSDALDLRWRVKGETTWNKERITSSPYRLEIPPDPNGLAVTLEMQGIFIEDSKPVGNWSDIKIVVARA
jgi:hypothetical protein